MLLQACENKTAGVERNLKPALEAICAFFKLSSLFEQEADVWWELQHRALEESLLIAHLLAPQPAMNGDLNGGIDDDPIFGKAKEDVVKMLQITERYRGSLEMHKTRKEVLQDAYDKIVM